MATAKKVKIGVLYKVGAFLAFLMLGYLGIRGYKNSVEKLKINGCISEISEMVYNIKQVYEIQKNYGELDYKLAVKLNLFPKNMFREGFKEATNSYMGGVDIFYSALNKDNQNGAVEISFQGISKAACEALIRIDWDNGDNISCIAVAGYSGPTPSGVLDAIYPDTKQDDIKGKNIFKSSEARYIGSDKIDAACGCVEDTCTVVWKFR